MKKIPVKFILGAEPRPETAERLREEVGANAETEIVTLVFEATYNGNTYYCCWAGGKLLDDNDIRFTLVGSAAVESLAWLPFGDNSKIIFKELKINSVPLPVKVHETFAKYPPNSKIAFFGDMAGELDGKLQELFDPTGFVEV